MQPVTNNSPLLETHPYQSPLERAQLIFFITVLLAPYGLYFIQDALIGQNEVLNCISITRPFTAGAIVRITEGDIARYFPQWSNLPKPVRVEIGNELWSTGLRTIRQLRALSENTPIPGLFIYHVSFPSNTFKDVRATYRINAEEMLHYPNPIQADYASQVYDNGWHREIDCSPPASQFMSLSPWPHTIHKDFDGYQVRSSSFGNRYPPITSQPVFITPPTIYDNHSGTTLPSPSASAYKLDVISDQGSTLEEEIRED